MSKFNTFPDKGQVASYAVSQVAWCVDKGIITGWDNRLLAPEMIVDRAQMSKVMMNVVQNKIIK